MPAWPQGSGSPVGEDMGFKRWMMGIRGKLIAIFVVIKVLPLLLLALLGGSAGAWLGMQVFRHKTQHLKFKYGVPVIFLIQLAGAVWF